MSICLCVTNFKNDLVEAISKTAVDFAILLNEKATCILYTPGRPTGGKWKEKRLENASFAPDRDYHSKVRVFHNIVALGRYMRSTPRNFDLIHFHVGNFLELFLIRALLPKLNATKVVTVWQPYLNVGESCRLSWTFRTQLKSIIHHYLFNSWPLIPLFWLGSGYFDRIVVHTEHQRRQLSFLRRPKVQVIANGVPVPGKLAERPETSPPRVLYVGHATAVKGLDVLLSALGRARKHASFVVTLALTDFRKVDVPQLITLNGLDDIVTVKGHVNVLEEFRRHDVLVIPHKTSVGTSCYPNIALEAFSVGIPVIASATEVLAEIIEDRVTGFLVPPSDVARLEQALVSLLNTSEEAEGMAERQQEVFKSRFTLDRYVERHLQMYRELQGSVPAASRSGVSGLRP